MGGISLVLVHVLDLSRVAVIAVGLDWVVLLPAVWQQLPGKLFWIVEIDLNLEVGGPIAVTVTVSAHRETRREARA